MTIEEMKRRKTELGLTNEMIAEQANLPLSTVQKIFAGVTKAPRKLTIDALSAVLSAPGAEYVHSVGTAVSGYSSSTAASGHSAGAIKSIQENASDGSDEKEAEWRRIHEQYIEATFLQNLTPGDIAVAKLLSKKLPGRYEVVKESAGQYDAVREPAGQYEAVRESAGQYGSALPEDRKNTLEDYYALPDDQRYELIDGHFYDMGFPTLIHQLILGQLHFLFHEWAEIHEMPCVVLQSPCDVRLDRDNYTMVQPDLLVLCHGLDIHASRYEGAPDLVVEVLSPSSRMKDMVLKLHKYQRAGVREYWIVDPKNKSVTVHHFTDQDYDPKKYSFTDKIPVGISDGQCSIDFARIQEWLARFESRNP